MDLFLQVILSWVLRALNVREENIVKPIIEIRSLQELNGAKCDYDLSPHCVVHFTFDYPNNTIYIAETIKYSENSEANAEIVEALVLFVLSGVNRSNLPPTTELEIARKALSLSERSKTELIRYLVI